MAKPGQGSPLPQASPVARGSRGAARRRPAAARAQARMAAGPHPAPCTTVTVAHDETKRTLKLKWYGAPEQVDVERAAAAGFGLAAPLLLLGDDKPEWLGNARPAAIDLTDGQSGAFVEVSKLTDGARLVVRRSRPRDDEEDWRSPLKMLGVYVGDEPVPPTVDGLREHGGWRDVNFQRTMLGMERIRSHLANERNFLAWTRCSLTLAAQGITFWKYYDESDGRTRWLKSLLRCTTFSYFIIAAGTTAVGLHRWTAAKKVLDEPRFLEVSRHFGRVGVWSQGVAIVAVCLAAALSFVALGLEYFDGLRRR